MEAVLGTWATARGQLVCVCVCVCVYSALYIKEEVHTSGARTELGVERRWKMKVPYFFISRKCLLLSLLIL